MQDEKGSPGVRVRKQGTGVVERKRVTALNDVQSHVCVPRQTVAEIVLLASSASADSLDALLGTLATIRDLIEPYDAE
jgi:hypothetical protein